MLWNWYTVDSCFLSTSWHVRSNAAFAGSCIGAIFLVISLEFLRRAGREYDRSVIRSIQKARSTQDADSASARSNNGQKGAGIVTSTKQVFIGGGAVGRPSIVQHGIRSFFYMCQFAVGYIIMLLAM
jgi:solute carrier family 31 (copper transporter), member 1